MGANVLRILHGEEEYEYFGTLHPGDDITGELEIMSIDRKEGSGGAMDMVKTEATYRKQTGEVVAIAGDDGGAMVERGEGQRSEGQMSGVSISPNPPTL